MNAALLQDVNSTGTQATDTSTGLRSRTELRVPAIVIGPQGFNRFWLVVLGLMMLALIVALVFSESNDVFPIG